MAKWNSKLQTIISRNSDAHKGQFGHALLIGGAMGMTGAISIAGLACLRSGAGLVTLGVPSSSLVVVAGFSPSYMTMSLPSDEFGRLGDGAEELVLSKISERSCIAIGPGLGRSAVSDRLVRRLFSEPVATTIFDADALNALSESDAWRVIRDQHDPQADPASKPASEFHRILTPHPGEWERLSGVSAANRRDQEVAADRIAMATKSVIVLKGNGTWITDGTQSVRNETGNPSLACGGNGDCLTGMIAAFVCQGLAPFDAAALAVHLHGVAGDIAHKELGTPSTLPTDIIAYLPMAFRSFKANEPTIGFQVR
jgi:NAD(P)H-hydrate epimerase